MMDRFSPIAARGLAVHPIPRTSRAAIARSVCKMRGMKSDHAIPKATIRFLRVSTRSQVDIDAYGFKAQERWCILNERKHGLRVVDVVQEVGSGVASQREGLQRLLERAEELGAVAVSIAAVDRLSRHLLDGPEFLKRLLGAGLTVYAADVSRPIHHGDRKSIADFNDRERHASAELDSMVRRTSGGRMAKAVGVDGTPTPPIGINAFGWINGAIDPAEAELVRRVYGDVLLFGGARVAKRMNVDGLCKRSGRPWAKEDLLRMVRNPLYRGVHEYGRQAHCERCHSERAASKAELRDDRVQCELCGAEMRLDRVQVPVEAIVSESDWIAANQALDHRRNTGSRSPAKVGRAADVNELALLKGRLRCGHCGGAMTSVLRKGKDGPRIAYQCQNAINKREFSPGKICRNGGSHLGAPLHDLVRAELVRLLCEGPVVQAFLDRQSALVERLTREARRARKALENEIAIADAKLLKGGWSEDRYNRVVREREAQLDRLAEDEWERVPTKGADLHDFVGSTSLVHLLSALQAHVAVWADEGAQIVCDV